MIPKTSESLRHMAERVGADLIPKASDDYAAADLAFLTMMLSMIGQDFDRFADVHVREHAEMCALFEAAMPHLPADLQARARSALSIQIPGLLAHDLNARSDVTTRLLIDIHADVEARMDAGDAWARDLDARIWTYLDAYAQRRAYSVAF